jgi:hypothetical protein
MFRIMYAINLSFCFSYVFKLISIRYVQCGKTALLTAVSKQKLDIARLLIDGGANLDIQDIVCI